MNWKELCIGYGIEKLPSNLKGLNLQCAFPCPAKYPLYTTKPLKPRDHTTYAYDQMMRNLIGNCYCKVHMMYMYGEQKT